MIRINYLHSVLEYRDGILYWLTGLRSGRIAGSLTSDGYRTINFRPNKHNGLEKRLFIRLHRIIFAMHYGRLPKKELDHINGDRLDNRIENLREVTSSQQKMNTVLRSNNTTGVKGVRYCNSSKKSNYQAFIYCDGKFIHLGLFVKFSDAVMARREAEKKHHGKYARAIVS